MCKIHLIGSSYPFLALGKWLQRTLRPVILRYNHLLKDSRHLIAQLRNVQIEASDILGKADVKDFFMSGQHAELAQGVSSFFQGNFALLIKDIVLFILDNQWVDNGHEGSCSKVLVGSGMGINVAGDLADLAFLCQLELPYALRVNRMWCDVHGLSVFHTYTNGCVFQG